MPHTSITLEKPKVCFLIGMPERWSCKACGECCPKYEVTLFSDEAKELPIETSYRDGMAEHSYLVPKVQSMMSTDFIPQGCPLQKDGKCSVHSQKPLMCQAFPFQRVKLFYRDNFACVSFASACKHYNEPDQEPVTVERCSELIKPILQIAGKMYGFDSDIHVHPKIFSATKVGNDVIPKDEQAFKDALERYSLSTSDFDSFVSEVKMQIPQDYP